MKNCANYGWHMMKNAQASSSSSTSCPRTLKRAWCTKWYPPPPPPPPPRNNYKNIKFLNLIHGHGGLDYDGPEHDCHDHDGHDHEQLCIFRWRGWRRHEAAHPPIGAPSWIPQWWVAFQSWNTSISNNLQSWISEYFLSNLQQSLGHDSKPPTYRQDL